MASHNPWTPLHAQLVERQPDGELERKAARAHRRGFWTVEDLDAADRQAQRFVEKMKWV